MHVRNSLWFQDTGVARLSPLLRDPIPNPENEEAVNDQEHETLVHFVEGHQPVRNSIAQIQSA